VAGRATKIADAGALGIPGPHNLANAMASLAALHALGYDVTAPAVAAALRGFRGLEHRIEYVGEMHGVRFYNDSKATNTDSLAVALRAFREPIVLIAGGRDKKGDFPSLAAGVAEHVAVVVTIGEAAPTIRAAWGSAVTDWVEAGYSFERAVEAAYQEAAVRGGVVLLSPGCASFDMFKDYEDRGRRFKEIVHALGAERRDG
jgi:UDP-N-acetylmuramoylalanine--D-glutamate ligase